MPRIIPIKELKNTSEISALCHETDEPVFITKNGFGDLVIMSMETYEKTICLQSAHSKLEQAERGTESEHTKNAGQSLQALQLKHEI